MSPKQLDQSIRTTKIHQPYELQAWLLKSRLERIRAAWECSGFMCYCSDGTCDVCLFEAILNGGAES